MSDRDQLVLDNINIAYKLAHKYTPIATWGLDVNEEAQGDALLGLVRAADTWDPDRGVPFGAYAGLVIRRYITDAYRKRIGWRPDRGGERPKVQSLDAMLEIADENGMPHKLARAITAPDRTDAIACSPYCDALADALDQLDDDDLEWLFEQPSVIGPKRGMSAQGASYHRMKVVRRVKALVNA